MRRGAFEEILEDSSFSFKVKEREKKYCGILN